MKDNKVKQILINSLRMGRRNEKCLIYSTPVLQRHQFKIIIAERGDKYGTVLSAVGHGRNKVSSAH